MLVFLILLGIASFKYIKCFFPDISFSQVKLEGDIDQGVAYYKKALYYNWHYADAMYNLGVAYGEMLNFDMVILNSVLRLPQGIKKNPRREKENP